MAEKDLNKVVDDIAASIRQLVSDLETREKSGDILKPKDVRAIASQLHAHVTNLLSAVGRQRQERAGK